MKEIARLDVPFDEFRVWQQRIRPHCEQAGAGQNALNVLEHVATEMLNNVVDHAGSPDCVIEFDQTPNDLLLAIIDHGIGAFRRVADGLKLDSPEDALIEIAKGKTTTDPRNHTGEGIFFSARVCDWFCVSANGHGIEWKTGGHPGLLKYSNPQPGYGTKVNCRVAKQTAMNLKAVFDEFCPAPDNLFSRTAIPLRLVFLAQGALVSRSQGKRVVNGLSRFAQVTFDFADVPTMQQGFADEVFRVWRQANPEIQIEVINAAPDVATMLRHVGFSS